MALPQKLEDVSLERARELRDQFLRDWPEFAKLAEKLIRETGKEQDGNEEQPR